MENDNKDKYIGYVFAKAIEFGIEEVRAHPRDRAELVLHVLANMYAEQRIEIDKLNKKLDKMNIILQKCPNPYVTVSLKELNEEVA